eukprot:13887539-Ditylum_brightwellii.AAC.1
MANGVFTRLAGLTSNIAANANKQIDELYLDHAEALFIVDLAPPTNFPSFQDSLQAEEEHKN